MRHRVIVLWSVPRSVSTSFERMMAERGDHTVMDEPFSPAYYFGPERRSPRYDETMPECSMQSVLDSIEDAARERPVFVKDLAYQAAPVLTPGTLSRFENVFLVRDPAATLRSLAEHWPDFTDEETGWGRLGEAADIAESLGQPRVVLDANLLCEDPGGVVRRWCELMDLPYLPEALSWEPGMQPGWDLWPAWHGSTSRATGFGALRPPPPPPGPDEPRLHEAYLAAEPVYRRLLADAIGVPDSM